MIAGAYVAVLGKAGRTSSMICEACQLVKVYDRTAPAQEAAREHNAEKHPDAPMEPEA